MSEPMSEIRKAVILNLYLARHSLLVRHDNWEEVNKNSTFAYFNDINFQNYCETLCAVIYGQISKLNNEIEALKAELDGADKVIQNLKSK